MLAIVLLFAASVANLFKSRRRLEAPPQPSLAAIYATSMAPPPDPRYSADWAAALAEDNARREAVAARRVEEEAAAERERRRVYEASLLRR